MEPQTIITLISVCAASTVSILGILLPAYLAQLSSKRASIAAHVERINEKAEKLSLSLSGFRNPDFLKETKQDGEARIRLRANHDAWEIVIFSELDEDRRNKTREMRRSQYGFEYLTGKDENGEANIMKLIDNVVEFTCYGISKLNRSASNWKVW